jgi:sialate O-acetylesterase
MKIKTTTLAMAAVSLLASANANLIQNGDLEADGYTGSGINNSVVAITNWSGTTKISTTGDNNTIPEAPNTVFRMQDTTSVWQNFYADWGATNTFTLTLNACEVYWRSGDVGNNLLWVSLRSAAGTEYEAVSIDLQGTHGGSGVTYSEWQSNQTHTVQFSGQDLIDSGATAGEELRLNIYSGDINWVDNIALTGAEAGVPPEPPTVDYGSPFQNGMVLQRGKPIKIWGTDDPTHTVTVSINGNSAQCVADENGDWRVELPAMAAGGAYELSASSNGLTNKLSDVLVGDVWIAFGQSNMVRPLSEMTNKETYIADITTNRMIRCLEIAQDAALTPQSEGEMTWRDNSNPGGWSSVAAVFAHQMHAGSGVPTAVIWAGWGSSSIEGWMPIQMTNDFPHFDTRMDYYQSIDEYNNGETTSNLAEITAMLNGETAWNDVFIRTRPNIIYNQRIHPLLNLGISGFVWYQGEANAGTPENVAQYGFSLPAFVTEYRELFDQGDLPFLGVQLPSYNSTYWAWFRESQNRVTALSNAYVAVTIDTGLANNIHPYDKEPIGQRLALLGRKYALGQDIEAHGPIFESMSISGNEATIGFSHADGLTTDDTLDPAEFELAGSNEVWYDATSASISGTNVIISSTSVAAPVAVRYAWSPAPVNTVNLTNGDGLPAAPFRTDDWMPTDLGDLAPMAINDSYEMLTNATLVIAADGVLENDMDLNRDELTASLVSDVSNGTLSLSAAGSFSYTPNADFSGYDTFVYSASDGALSDSATVTIAVRALDSDPIVADDLSAAVDENGSVAITLSGSGPEGLTYRVVSQPANGTLTTNGALPNLTYTPDADFSGNDLFTYTANVGDLYSAEATVSITVNEIIEPGSELISNGDLELNDGVTGNNQSANITDWVGTVETFAPEIRCDLGDGSKQPDAGSVMARLISTGTSDERGLYQDFRAGAWDSTSEFTIRFNASEVWWNAGGSNTDGITVSLGDQGGGNAESVYLNLDGSYDAANEPYVSWTSNQTHKLTITGAELIAAGVTAGEGLRLDLSSTYTSANSIIWVDNISVVLEPEAAAPEFVPGGTTVSNGNLVVSFAGTVGGPYTIEFTDDLTDTTAWSAVTNWSSLPASPIEVTLSTTNPAAFYRVATP